MIPVLQWNQEHPSQVISGGGRFLAQRHPDHPDQPWVLRDEGRMTFRGTLEACKDFAEGTVRRELADEDAGGTLRERLARIKDLPKPPADTDVLAPPPPR